MGFTKFALRFLVDDFNKRGCRPRGKLLTLSRYKICFDLDYFNHVSKSYGWDARIDDKDKTGLLLNDDIVFSALGFEHLDSMDYSDYEGANILFDLNSNEIPKELENKYDCIIDGGTIEHIFHLPNVFANIFKMLAVGGTFHFEVPICNQINHGYYCLSPCFLYDYFTANKYIINDLHPIMYDKSGGHFEFDPITNDLYSTLPYSHGHGVMLIYGSVTKTSDTISNAIPFQGLYRGFWETNYNKIIYDSLKEMEDNSVYFYGTGKFAANILEMLPNRYRNKVAGLISKNEDEINQYKFGYMVYSLEDVAEQLKTIIIVTSSKFQKIVYNRIKYLENDGVKIIQIP